MYLRKTEFEGVDWLILIQDRVENSLNIQLIFGCHKGSKFLDQMSNGR